MSVSVSPQYWLFIVQCASQLIKALSHLCVLATQITQSRVRAGLIPGILGRGGMSGLGGWTENLGQRLGTPGAAMLKVGDVT